MKIGNIELLNCDNMGEEYEECMRLAEQELDEMDGITEINLEDEDED